LHSIDDPPSPIIGKLLRKPYPAQTLAIMGLVRRWQQARAGAVIAECGTGKTLISLGAVHTHAEARPFTALAMVPPQLVEKWCRETFLTLPRVRVFIIDGLRTPTHSNGHHGVNEVKLRNKRIVREGLRTSVVQAPADRPIAGRNFNPLLPQGPSDPFQEQLLRAADQHRRASQADKRFDRSTAVEFLVEPPCAETKSAGCDGTK
jgi:hypothetical protein